IATRIISEFSRVPSERIRRGDVDHEEFGRIYDAARELEGLPFYIDDTGGISIAQVAARARRLKRQHGLDMLIIDYLQLLTGTGKRNDNRVQEITEISMGLKTLAKELNIPVVALSQLSRQVESREDKRPQLSDLRESGSIEQDADVVMFLFREEYYHSRAMPGDENSPEFQIWQDRNRDLQNVAELIIGKQRHGPIGTVKLHFESEFTKFSNLAKQDLDEYGNPSYEG
ncbi:MAG: DnaB-like helicase C-terminal domain-containing protein, partial [Pseudomonadota bacterium]